MSGLFNRIHVAPLTFVFNFNGNQRVTKVSIKSVDKKVVWTSLMRKKYDGQGVFIVFFFETRELNIS